MELNKIFFKKIFKISQKTAFINYMIKLKYLWHVISHLGTEHLSSNAAKRVILTNRACFVLLLISLFFIFPWGFKGNIFMVFMNVMLVTLYSFLLWLNHIKKFDVPKYFMIFFVSTPIFMAAGMLGKASNLHFSLIPIAGFSVLLFDPKEKIKIILSIAYPMILLGILIIDDFKLFPNLIGRQLEIIPAFEYLINIFIVLSTMLYLYFSNNKAETNYKILYEEHIQTQKHLDEERAKAIHATKMVTLGEMAGGIAHEINGPLHIINILTRKISKGVEAKNLDDEKLMDIVNQIQKTSFKMAGIVKSLVSISRPSYNDPLLSTDLNSLIQETLIVCQYRFHLRSEVIDVDCKENLPNVLCRPGEISQVLINLLNNAYDATSLVKEPRVKVEAKQLENKILLSVEDNGHGVPAEIKEKIFETFFTTKEIGKGTGLGLSISRQLINANNGRLFVESSPGSTRFIIELQVV